MRLRVNMGMLVHTNGVRQTASRERLLCACVRVCSRPGPAARHWTRGAALTHESQPAAARVEILFFSLRVVVHCSRRVAVVVIVNISWCGDTRATQRVRICF